MPGHQGGESETVIGKWLGARGGRDRIVLATEVGMATPDGSGLWKAHIIASVDAWLKRLKTDVIDLYQSHCDDEAIAVEETLAAYGDLIERDRPYLWIGATYLKARAAGRMPS